MTGRVDVALKYQLEDLLNMLQTVKMRSDDETLKASDPRRRPLIPPPGEEVPEEERGKQTLLDPDAG